MLLSQFAAAFGYMISASFESMEQATIMGPLFVMPMVLFGGFMANVDSLPAWFGWLQYLSPIRYCFEIMVRTQTGNLPEANVPILGPINIQHEITDFLGFNIGTVNCIIITVAFVVFYRIMGIFFLKNMISKFQ
jgi:ATP-binding cassette subfamily G (WHITE) protein 2